MDGNKNEIKYVRNEPEKPKTKWGCSNPPADNFLSSEVSSNLIGYHFIFLSLIGIYNRISNWYRRVRSRLYNSIFNVFNRTKKEVKNSDESELLQINVDCQSSRGEISSVEESSVVLRNSLEDFLTNSPLYSSAPQEVLANGTDLENLFEMVEGAKNVIYSKDLLHTSGGICIETEVEAPTLLDVDGFQIFV